MVTERDFVQLPYTRDLTEAGLLYARRVLPNRPVPASPRVYDAIRRTVASVAVNLSFRRYLDQQGIEFGVVKPAIFTDPERYDVQLDRRTCELKSYLISRVPQWEALSNDPALALAAPALVPLDRHTSETVRARDAYAFAFVGAGIALRGEGDQGLKVQEGEQWVHVMPRSWQANLGQTPLGRLMLKTEQAADVHLELTGQDRYRAPVEISVRLDGGQSAETSQSLVTLSYISTKSRPSGRLGIRSATRRQTHVIRPGDWHNVWLEGWGIVLLGWITRQEFRTRARLVPQGRRVFQFDRTRTRNLAVAVKDLKPIAELIRNATASRAAS